MKSDLIDVTMRLHHETAAAILVSETGDRQKAVWLPKSAIEVETKPKGIVVITLPEWLAMEKGLV